ncbi:MAG: Ig-like domain-containing protein, partial [Clostridia bacterium]|nr:Ig-like domain-containing protein [Clostridia bacterium]
ESMIQSDPVVITDDDSADGHPQLVAYSGSPLLFWNNDGRISCTDLTDYRGGTPEEDLPFMERLEPGGHSNAASSFFVTVQPNGALCIVWTDWAEGNGENGQTPAVFFREFDPDYKMPTGDDEQPYLYGNWGNAQLLASAGADQDISEIAYLDLGDRIVIAYKLTNKDENSWIASYDSYHAVLKEDNSLDFGLTFEPVCPLPGEPAALTVTVTNTGSLPTEKVTVKAELIDRDERVTPIGTQSFTGHYQSNGVVAAVFDDFVYPEQPEGCSIRVTAWENDLRESAVIRKLPLPCDADISFADIELTPLEDGRHLLSADVENNGNKALDGLLLIGYGEPTGPNGAQKFTDLAEPVDLSVDFKDAAHAVMCFAVPDDLYDEDGVCRLSLVAIDDTGAIYAEQTIVLHEDKAEDAVPADIRTNAENGELVLQKGDVASLEAAILPYAARSGYRIEYTTNDPAVAEIDAQGNLTARKAGETVVTVSVVKTESALFINSDCKGSTGDGKPLVIDENGWITGLEDTEAGTAVLTKEIAVTVKAGAEDPAPGDSAPIFFWIALAMIVVCGIVFLSVKAAKAGLRSEGGRQ